jgi:biopolymer transport protein ExbD
LAGRRLRCPKCAAIVEAPAAQHAREPRAPDKPGRQARADAQSRLEDDAPRPAFQAKRRSEDAEMDMTPMVDVVFQLLIFFMLTAAFALQKSIAVPKSADDQPSDHAVVKPLDEASEYVTVRVDEFNTYQVITADAEEEAPSVQDLHILLRRAREGSSAGTIPTKLRVTAHGDALHGRVVAALDAGAAAGFEEVQLSTVEEDEGT